MPRSLAEVLRRLEAGAEANAIEAIARAADRGWVGWEEIAELVDAIPAGADRIFDELAVEPIGDRVRVSLHGDVSWASPAALVELLRRARMAHVERSPPFAPGDRCLALARHLAAPAPDDTHPLVAEALYALQSRTPVPSGEPAGEGADAIARLARWAPEMAAELRASAHGIEAGWAWRGPTPSIDAGVPQMLAAWSHQAASLTDDDMFLLVVGDDRILLACHTRGRRALFYEGFVPLLPCGLAERLRFTWRHRATFRDGIAFLHGELTACARWPLSAEHGVMLIGADLTAIIRIAPAAELVVGRGAGCHVFIAIGGSHAGKRRCARAREAGRSRTPKAPEARSSKGSGSPALCCFTTATCCALVAS